MEELLREILAELKEIKGLLSAQQAAAETAIIESKTKSEAMMKQIAEMFKPREL
jgi:hypothetical protein